MKVPNFTTWIVFENTNATQLCGLYSYFNSPSNISYLSVTHGNLGMICPDTLGQIVSNSSVTSLDLRNNKLSQMPQVFAGYTHLHIKVWLAGNPLKCSCEMVWLINWLATDGKQIVKDYEEVTCRKGRQIGQPIYLLKPLDMGCYPRNTSLFITMSLLGGVVTFLMITMGLIVRSSDFRWLIYRNFGQLVGDPDKDEEIDAMVFDAFVSFR